ncbi:MAG: recombinase family protein [Candidatus Sulfotelmatobacter sp.]
MPANRVASIRNNNGVSVRESGGQARFEPVAEQAEVVQQIFAWIGRDRCSLAEVSRRLHKAGTPTATGKSIWSREAVWHVLQACVDKLPGGSD